MPKRLSLHRINAYDTALCLRFNRACRWPAVLRFFRAVSRVGDGGIWYVLMALLPVLHGPAGWHASLRLVLAGGLGVVIYKWLKVRTLRPRPYQVYSAITAGTAPLDQFSFPSGHTLHAASFTWIACSAFPELTAMLVPLAVLVGLSRPILGLHYPSDVLAGAGLGVLVGRLVVCIV